MRGQDVSACAACDGFFFRAEKILPDRLFAHAGIKVLWNKAVDRFVGGPGAEGLIALDLWETQTGEMSRIDVDGGFVAIGHYPATELFRDQVDLDGHDYMLVKPGTSLTSVEAVFACGDVTGKVYRQAITAAGTGCMAALDAERFLQDQDFQMITHSQPEVA